jgi:hypothetical protein
MAWSSTRTRTAITCGGIDSIPDCTDLDHDGYIDPGAAIETGIERLGALRSRFAEPAGKSLRSRWPLRSAPREFRDRQP